MAAMAAAAPRALAAGRSSGSLAGSARLHRPAGRPCRGPLVCRAASDPELMKRLGDKGIQLEGVGNSHDAMPGLEFAQKLEERMTGVPTMESTEPGLLAEDGSKASDALEIAWDPEGLLGKPEDDLIAKRLAAKQEELESEAEEEAKAEYESEREKLLAMRAARVVPENDPAALAQFFFDTEFNEIEYECTRCRPQMTPEFFDYMKKMSKEAPTEEEQEKFSVMAEELNKFVAFLDANAKALAEPADRMKAILQAKDKKAIIQEMAGNNEIDTALIALFQTNVNMARQAGQEEPAMFMEKVMNACKKYANL